MLTPAAPARSAMFAATTSGPSARKSSANAATVVRTSSPLPAAGTAAALLRASAFRTKVVDHEGEPCGGGDGPLRHPRDHERRLGTAGPAAPRGRPAGLPDAGAHRAGRARGGARRAHRIHAHRGHP